MTDVIDDVTGVTYETTDKAVTCAGCRHLLGFVGHADTATALGGLVDVWIFRAPEREPATPSLGAKWDKRWKPPHAIEEDRRRAERRHAAEPGDADAATGAPAVVLVVNRAASLAGDVWTLGPQGTQSLIPLPATIKCRHCPGAFRVGLGHDGWKSRAPHAK
jgi:hypothetical protein